MANLKNLLVNGPSRFIGDTAINGILNVQKIKLNNINESPYCNIIGNGTGIYFSIDGTWGTGKGNICIEGNTLRPSGTSASTMMLGNSGSVWSKFYINNIISGSNNIITVQASDSTDIAKFKTDTDSVTGSSMNYKTLMLGTANTALGRISLYSHNSNYQYAKGGFIQQAPPTINAWIKHLLPASSGWIVKASESGVGSSSQPVYISSSGVVIAITGALANDITGTATNATQLISNNRMDYGWNGVNYFNISASNQSAAKVNDTPYASNTWTHILRFNHANNNGYYTDLSIPFNSNDIYYKRIANGVLQNNNINGGWINLLDSLNYSNYTVTKTGSGASGTWGISITGNAATASTTKALKTADITTGSNITSHADVIQQYFSANYSSVPRKSLLSFYSDKKSPGSQYFGYYIDNYNTNPCGSFFAMHYNDDPVYVGISGGTYTERTILTDDGAGNFLPTATNTYNLGSSTYQWNALYMNKLQVPSTGVIQANLPIKINGGENYSNNIPGANASSLVIYKPDNDYPAIELYRHTSSGTSAKASWQLINENGTFKIKENWNGTTENSTYTETLLAISPTNKLFTTYAPITANAPIKVIHAAGGQKEFEITYGSNIDFSLMVGTGNVNHGLYDSKIGSTGAWVLNTDSSHEWMFTGKKVYLAGSINANTALNSSQLVLSAVENETSGKALGIEMCYTGSDVINNSSGKQRQSWQILNDLGTLKIRTNGNGSQYESGYVETPIQIDRDSLTSITRLKPKSVEGTFYYENSNKFTIANNGSRYKKILLSKNGNNSAIFSNPPTENGLYIISVLLLIRVPSISTNNIFYAAGLGVLPWASISAGTYDWIDITSEGFGDSHISIKLDYRNSDTIISIETKSSTYLGGRSVEIGPKGCQIHMIKIGNHFPTSDDVY